MIKNIDGLLTFDEEKVDDGINFAQWKEWDGEIITLKREDTRWVYKQLKKVFEPKLLCCLEIDREDGDTSIDYYEFDKMPSDKEIERIAIEEQGYKPDYERFRFYCIGKGELNK